MNPFAPTSRLSTYDQLFKGANTAAAKFWAAWRPQFVKRLEAQDKQYQQNPFTNEGIRRPPPEPFSFESFLQPLALTGSPFIENALKFEEERVFPPALNNPFFADLPIQPNPINTAF